MIISIYGLERSGKTTLIHQLQKHFGLRSIHFRKSKCINEYAGMLFGKRDDGTLTDFEEKVIQNYVEKRFLELSSEFELMFMDCHCLFYEPDKGFFDFRKDWFHDGSDLYFYLNTSPNIILQRMVDTNGQKSNYNFDLELITNWQKKELNETSKIAKRNNKKFIVIDSNDDPFEVILKTISNNI